MNKLRTERIVAADSSIDCFKQSRRIINQATTSYIQTHGVYLYTVFKPNSILKTRRDVTTDMHICRVLKVFISMDVTTIELASPIELQLLHSQCTLSAIYWIREPINDKLTVNKKLKLKLKGFIHNAVHLGEIALLVHSAHRGPRQSSPIALTSAACPAYTLYLYSRNMDFNPSQKHTTYHFGKETASSG
jgi:hypothetical protein